MNLPTRTEGMTSRFASTTVPSAVFNLYRGITGLRFQADATGKLGRDGGEAGSRVEDHFRGDFAETGVNVEDAILAMQLDVIALDRTLGFLEELDGFPDLRRRAQPAACVLVDAESASRALGISGCLASSSYLAVSSFTDFRRS